MENKYTDTNANTEANNTAEKSESARMSFGETLSRILIETPMAVDYAHSIIRTASEASEKYCESQLGKDIPAPLRVDTVCEAVIAMFKDPDCLVNKDRFLRGAVAVMVAQQMKKDFEKQTGKSLAKAAADFYKANKKGESDDV